MNFGCPFSKPLLHFIGYFPLRLTVLISWGTVLDTPHFFRTGLRDNRALLSYEIFWLRSIFQLTFELWRAHIRKLLRLQPYLTSLTLQLFRYRFRWVPSQWAEPSQFFDLLHPKCLHYQKRLQGFILPGLAFSLDHDISLSQATPPTQTAYSKSLGSYFAGGGELDDFLIKVRSSHEISLVLIVEGNWVVLVHG